MLPGNCDQTSQDGSLPLQKSAVSSRHLQAGQQPLGHKVQELDVARRPFSSIIGPPD